MYYNDNFNFLDIAFGNIFSSICKYALGTICETFVL